MAHWFDDLAVSVAEQSPRRTALRRVGAGVVGAIGLLVLGGSRASAWGSSQEDDDEEEERNKNRCDPGLIRCGQVCVVKAIDPDNCGGCGIRCASGKTCRGGQCKDECPPASCNVVTCGSGETACGKNCCSSLESCVNGTCQIGCPTGMVRCDGVCIFPTTDDNCGASCTNCQGGKHCVNGVCMCPPGESFCQNMCVPLTTTDNCGACGNKCAFPHATAMCVGGNCVIGMCNTGFGNCNGSTADGCETDLRNDPNNCGLCGNVCPSGSCTIGICDPIP